MEMKQHIIDTFNFNSGANLKMLEKIKELPDKTEAMRFFSHIINCQYKWMARIMHDSKGQEMSCESLFVNSAKLLISEG